MFGVGYIYVHEYLVVLPLKTKGVAIMPTLLSLAALQVVIMTTCGAPVTKELAS